MKDRFAGAVIPATPLALTADHRLDEREQRALSRYHLAAGVTGLAVGVHTTQFELHLDQPLLRQVWRIAADTVREAGGQAMLVAGVAGETQNAVAEAAAARDMGYDAVLLSAWGSSETDEAGKLERARAVAEEIPVIGFYLQESVGGVLLSADYWRGLFDIENVVAVKTAPFDRYRTNTVVRTLLEHDRWNDVAVLTGNDDAIVADLVMPYRSGDREVRTIGGLLGQWSVGTKAAVDLVRDVRAAQAAGAIPEELLSRGTDLVDINAAVFDVDNDFAGCVPGINEVLRQQGLLSAVRCLGPDVLSPGQAERIADVRRRFPDLLDEEFVASHRDEWLR